MLRSAFNLLAATVVASLLATPGAATAQDFAIFSDFNSDTPGLPPATGGANQPTSIINAGVTVETTANGISTQPLVIDDGTCNQSYFGGVYYDLPTTIEEGALRVEATIAANQLTDGVVIEIGVSYLGNSIVRLRITNTGTLADYPGTLLGTYTANTPFRFRGDIDISTRSWACTIDNELNGFDDDPVTHGLPFVNPPASIPYIDAFYMSLFGSFSACTGSRVIAYDDVLIVSFLPIFTDDFENGNTLQWTATVP